MPIGDGSGGNSDGCCPNPQEKKRRTLSSLDGYRYNRGQVDKIRRVGGLLMPGYRLNGTSIWDVPPYVS